MTINNICQFCILYNPSEKKRLKESVQILGQIKELIDANEFPSTVTIMKIRDLVVNAEGKESDAAA